MNDEIIVIADAGGTKTQWLYSLSSNPKERKIYTTEGINIAVTPREIIADVIKNFSDHLLSYFKTASSCRLYFYGAGCNNEDAKNKLNELFSQNLDFKIAKSEFYSDLEGAARALYGDGEGTVCILGTGSASGVYNGKALIDSIPSLGYILGDEGSGAFMGKELLNALFKRELSEKIKVKLEGFTSLDLPTVIKNVYQTPGANRYLSSFIPFIKENEGDTEIDNLIERSLKLFITKNVLKYKNRPNNKLRFAGSVASLFQEKLIRISAEHGLEADKFLQNPILGLGDYYLD